MGPHQLKTFIRTSAEKLSIPCDQINIEMPADSTHGDWSCNIAMMVAKQMKRSPRMIAEELVKDLKDELQTKGIIGIAKIELAGPGFINVFLDEDGREQIIQDCLIEGDKCGYLPCNAKRILIEFVSANPTGPLHVGHARGAVLGDVLANILESQGDTVDREYYVNDFGIQVDTLVVSLLFAQYKNQTNCEHLFYGLYQGEYLVEMLALIDLDVSKQNLIGDLFSKLEPILATQEDAVQNQQMKLLIDSISDAVGDDAWQSLKSKIIDVILQQIKLDLKDFGVNHTSWASEKELQNDPSLLKKYLQKMSACKVDGQSVISTEEKKVWFHADKLGDDKARVLVKENGDTTYFASDVIYHAQKYDRGYDELINIMGIDHHGYTARILAAMQSLDYDPNRLTTILTQLVNLKQADQKISMSKRKGTFVTLRDLIDEVPADAARIMFLTRVAGAPLDFDIDKTIEKNNDNPLFYMQYAHARASSLIQAGENLDTPENPFKAADFLLDSTELNLIRAMAKWPIDLERAAKAKAPHQIFTSIYQFATQFHSWYSKMRVFGPDKQRTYARLELTRASRNVLRTGLRLMGVDAPTSM